MTVLPHASVRTPVEDGASLNPGAHIAVVGVSAAHVLQARRQGLNVRDTVALVAPGRLTLIPLLREPTEMSLARLIAVYGTAALNVDACRTPGPGWSFEHNAKTGRSGGSMGGSAARTGTAHEHEGGRWPTNLVFMHHAGCGERLCHVECPITTLKQHLEQAVDKTDAPTTYAFPRLATDEDVVQWVRALLGLADPPTADQEFLAARSTYLDGKSTADAARLESDVQIADLHAWLNEAEVEENAREHRVGKALG